jgi:hypothetical protein
MKKGKVILSAALTVFVVLILSGVLYSVKLGSRSAQAASVTGDALVVQPTNSQVIDQELADREAAYQDLIREANARLEQAQAEIESLRSQSSQVLPEEAAQIAASYIGQTAVYSVETIDNAGTPVYQVTFSSGDVVLISMSGAVLAVQPAPQTPGFSTGFFTGGEHEHEEFEDED